MEELLNKFNELIRNHKELCFKTNIVNNKFKIFIVSNKGPIYIELDEKEYNNYDLDTDYFFDEYNNSFIANLDLLNSNFDSVCYFKTKDDNLTKYIGNVSDVIIPSNIKNINRDALSNNPFIKSLNLSNVTDISVGSINNLINLEKLYALNTKSIYKPTNIPNLKELYISPKLEFYHTEEILNNGFKLFVVNNNKVTDYLFDKNIDNKLFEETDARRLNNKEMSVARITNTDRRFNGADAMTRSQMIGSIAWINKILDDIPSFIKKLIADTNLTLYLTKGCFDDGGYIPEKNIMLVEVSNLKNSFFHELGHMLDYASGKTSDDNYFINIYESEKDKIYSLMNEKIRRIKVPDQLLSHYKSNKEEYFAESFNRYIQGYKLFKEECPLTYSYIEELINNLQDKHNKQIML